MWVGGPGDPGWRSQRAPLKSGRLAFLTPWLLLSHEPPIHFLCLKPHLIPHQHCPLTPLPRGCLGNSSPSTFDSSVSLSQAAEWLVNSLLRRLMLQLKLEKQRPRCWLKAPPSPPLSVLPSPHFSSSSIPFGFG